MRIRHLIISGVMFLVFLQTACVHDFQRAQKAYEKDDYQTVISLMSPHAEQGDPQAQLTLGLLYGKTEDYTEAFMWVRKAANQGIPYARFMLGMNV